MILLLLSLFCKSNETFKDSCPLSLIIIGTRTNIQRLRNSTSLTRPTHPNTTAGTTVDVGKSKLGPKWAQRDVMTLVSNQFKWFCPASFFPGFVVVARPLTEIKWNLWVYFIKFESSEHVRTTMNIGFFFFTTYLFTTEQVGKLLYKTQGNCFKFV